MISIELKGKEGQEKIKACLDTLRENPIKEINGVKVKTFFDYKESMEKDLESGEIKEVKLPKSNVFKYVLEDGSWFVIRPSGTEPKMKVYLAVVGSNLEDSNNKIKEFEKNIMKNIVL